MLTTLEVVLYAFVLVVLLPVALYSLLTGSQPPEKSWFAKYYRAEKYLGLAGNLFLLTLWANVATRLGLHFGYIDATAAGRLALPIGIPFAAALLAFLALWVRAALKVRRHGKGSV